MPGVGATDTPAPSSALLLELHLSPGSQLCLLPHPPGTLRGSPLPGLGAGGRRPPAAMTLCSSKSLSKHLGSPPPAQTSSPRPKHLPRLPCFAGPGMGPRATWPRRGLSPIWQSPPPPPGLGAGDREPERTLQGEAALGTSGRAWWGGGRAETLSS